jgi:hypothetical protein
MGTSFANQFMLVAEMMGDHPRVSLEILTLSQWGLIRIFPPLGTAKDSPALIVLSSAHLWVPG